jgi:hypothetical protein
MFEELARLRFFIPKPFAKGGRYTDKYPWVVLENIADGENVVRGKFPDENHALIFLNALRNLYVGKMKEEAAKIIEQTVKENR